MILPLVSCGLLVAAFSVHEAWSDLSLFTPSAAFLHCCPATKCCHSLVFLLLISRVPIADPIFFFFFLTFLRLSFISYSFSQDTPCSNYTRLFKIPQLFLGCSYLSLYIIFPLLNSLLDIFIIASSYHSRLNVCRCLWKAFMSHPRERAPPQPVHSPKLGVNTSSAVTPFLASAPQIVHGIHTLNFEWLFNRL